MSGVIGSGLGGASHHGKSGILGRFPSGQIIQTNYMTSDDYITTTSASYVTTSLTVTIAVRSASSYIMVNIVAQISVNDGTDGAHMRLNESTTSLAKIVTTYVGAGTDTFTNSYASFHLYHAHAQVAGTALAYTLNFRVQTAGSGKTAAMNDHNIDNQQISSMTLQEIEQ